MQQTVLKRKTVYGSISQILRQNGIKRNSGLWQDYEKAKRLICENFTADQRERAIRVIVDYLRI